MAPVLDPLLERATGRRLASHSLRPSALAPRGHALYTSALTPPPSVDLRPLLPPVDQSSELCGSASHALLTTFDLLSPATTPPRSRLFLDYEARSVARVDSRAPLIAALDVLARTGVCSEAAWPYAPELAHVSPTEEARAEAASHRILQALELHQDLHLLKQSLAEARPVTLGCRLFRSSERAGQHGIIPMPGDAERASDEHACHALLCVGYSDADEHLIVRNTWGPRWGYHGYGFLPYAYALDPQLCFERWTLRLKTPAHSLPAPAPESFLDALEALFFEDDGAVDSGYTFDLEGAEAHQDADLAHLRAPEDGFASPELRDEIVVLHNEEPVENALEDTPDETEDEDVPLDPDLVHLHAGEDGFSESDHREHRIEVLYDDEPSTSDTPSPDEPPIDPDLAFLAESNAEDGFSSPDTRQEFFDEQAYDYEEVVVACRIWPEDEEGIASSLLSIPGLLEVILDPPQRSLILRFDPLEITASALWSILEEHPELDAESMT